LRAHDRSAVAAARELRVLPDGLPEAVGELRARVKALEKALKSGSGRSGNGGVDLEALIGAAESVGGVPVLASVVDGVPGGGLLDLADRLKAKLGDAAIVLGAAGEGKVDLAASVAPAVVERGVKAGEIVRVAAGVVGGGGGGRDTAARAGGRDVEKLPDAISAARAAIAAALAG
jgi:alanyl-tRNA synthetase